MTILFDDLTSFYHPTMIRERIALENKTESLKEIIESVLFHPGDKLWPGSMPYFFFFICFRIIIQKAIVMGHMKSDLFFPARK